MVRAVISAAFLSVAAALIGGASAADTTYFYTFNTNAPVYKENGVPDITIIATNSSTPTTDATALLGSAVFENTIMEKGWDSFTTSPDRWLLKNQPAYAWYTAGYSEGYLLMEQINQTMYATTNTNDYTPGAMAFINQQVEYMQTTAYARRNTSAFWAQIHKQMIMLHGIADGYKSRQDETGFPYNHTFEQVILNNLFPEYDDILGAVQAQNFTGDVAEFPFYDRSKITPRKNSNLRPIDPENEHCSALIKVTNDDVFFGQSTWFSFIYYPGRAYKTYVMETAVSMSGSAGRIHSCDDWYQTSNMLSAMETSNEFTNNELFLEIHPNSVSEFMRVMAANYLATSGPEWVEYFSTNHSGTYCNQWMVLDYKLYTKGMNASTLPDNFFWLAEEIPLKVASADMTWYLRENTYWGSYNIPYFTDIYAASGFTEQYNLYGSFFQWDHSPRAQIFRRDHHKVTDLVSMQKMLRYNDWQNDALSTIPGCNNCTPSTSPTCAIAARFDLVPSDATFGDLAPAYSSFFRFGYFGSLDGKITSYDLISNNFTASFQQGPTHDTQPVFEWPAGNPRGQLPGMPQRFDFGWELFSPQQRLAVPAPQPASAYVSLVADVFRQPGTVTFDANGVPQMDLFVGLRGSYDSAKTANMIPLANAVYNVSGLTNGWDLLTVTGEQSLLQADDNAAYQAWYAAGVAEGYATARAIADVIAGRNFTTYPAANAFVVEHIAYMRSNALAKMTPFWKQVRKQLLQMEGIAAGMNLRNQQTNNAYAPKVTFFDIFMQNFRDEYDDVSVATAASEQQRDHIISVRGPDYGDHCSGLVKITEDDIFMAQLTWAGFNILIHKQHKTYVMDGTLTLSANAGRIVSGDDWYQTPNGLVVQETTNEFYNKSLYDLIKPQCVSEFMRVMAANYLAKSAPEWARLYSQEPSGTYCNQWMVLDDKLYTKGMNATALLDDTFWVIEEIPGLIRSADTTAFLRDNGYWASYNIPYFADIFEISGFAAKAEADGTFYSWFMTPRAEIFRRDHHKVTDLTTMMALMRYNDYAADPLSIIPNCTDCTPDHSPGLAISSRFDLISRDYKGSGYATRFKRGVWGGSDVKISSSSMYRAGYQSAAWAGPTNDDVETFYWDNNADDPAFGAAGLVQYYNFKQQIIAPNAVRAAGAAAQQFYVYNASAVNANGAPVAGLDTQALVDLIGGANVSVTATASYLGDAGLLATVAFNQSTATVGWEQITISPTASLFASAAKAKGPNSRDASNDLLAWFSAGVAEGYASIQGIKDTMVSLAVDYSPKAAVWVEEHIEYMQSNAIAKGNASSGADSTDDAKYWRQVRKQLLQMEGIAAGFNLRAQELGDATRFTFADIFKLNFNTEIGDVEGAVNSSSSFARDTSLDPERCSSLVRATGDDIYMSHVTWSGYFYLVGRQYKTYVMEVSVSMTSNAGVIASGDDFQIASTGIAAQETTLGFYNSSLFELIKPQCVSEFMRGMISSFLATTAKEWVDYFAIEHSGTYCNQWQALDYNKFSKGQALVDGTFWITEELPGMIAAEDMTWFLREKGYFPSYNIPYFPEIYNTAGFAEKEATYGDYYSWNNTGRHKMFMRAAPKINTIAAMQRMMRYNDWQNDEYSIIPNCPTCSPNHSPKIAIAARADLGPLNYTAGNWANTSYGRSFRQVMSGACDAKIVSAELMASFSAIAEQGPTHDQQPVFSWYDHTDSYMGQLSGMLQTFDFSFVQLSPLSTVPPSSDSSNKLAIILGAAIGGGVGLILIVVIGIVVYRKRSGYDDMDDNSYTGPLINAPHKERV